MRIGKRWAGCLAAGLFLLCAAGLLWLLGAETVPRQEPARLTPEAVSGAPGLDGLYLYAGPLSLEYTLPEQAEGPRSILEIRQLYAAAELRLDGAPFQNIPAGSGNLYVTLPPDWSGKALTLIMEKGAEDPEPSLYLTSSTVINELARADTSLRAFPAAAFGMIFLLALGLFLLYGALEGSWSWPVLLLSIAALGQAAYFYLQNSSLFSLPPALYGLALYQSRALLFAAPPLYLLLGMKKRRKAFAPFAVLPSLFYFVTAGFQTVVPLFSGIAVYAGLPRRVPSSPHPHGLLQRRRQVRVPGSGGHRQNQVRTGWRNLPPGPDGDLSAADPTAGRPHHGKSGCAAAAHRPDALRDTGKPKH